MPPLTRTSCRAHRCLNARTFLLIHISIAFIDQYTSEHLSLRKCLSSFLIVVSLVSLKQNIFSYANTFLVNLNNRGFLRRRFATIALPTVEYNLWSTTRNFATVLAENTANSARPYAVHVDIRNETHPDTIPMEVLHVCMASIKHSLVIDYFYRNRRPATLEIRARL